MPNTPLVVQMRPGPTPTKTPTAPVLIRWSAVVAFDPLGRQGGGGYDAAFFDFLDAAEDQLVLDGLAVDLLHHARRLVGRQTRYLLEDGARILVPGLYAFEVEDREAAEAPDGDG